MAKRLSAGSPKAANSRLVLDRPKSVPAGVVGLGLMGRSISTCLLAAGHRVVGVSESRFRRRDTRPRILALVREMKHERLFSGDIRTVMKNLQLSEDFSALGDCGIVIESVIEDLEAKQKAEAPREAAGE